MMQQLFPVPIVVKDSLEYKFDQGVKTFLELLSSGQWIIRVATSMGKDSSTMLAMVLKAASIASRAGLSYPPIIVSTANTTIENPRMDMLVKTELEKVRQYCAKHKINYKISIAKPKLFESFVVRVIGGNRLPTYTDGPAQCSMEWKVNVQNRQAKIIHQFVKKQYPGIDLLTCTGVRLDESEARKARILERGDKANEPFVYNQEACISPLLHFTEEDIFTFIATASRFDVYSDMQDVFSLYAEASGSGCAVVGDIVLEQDSKSRQGCGARFGCAFCTRTGQSDKSMEEMIKLPENEFMAELNAFRNYLHAIRFDPTKRRYLGRTIAPDGTVNIAPDTFSSQTLEDLWRMLCSIQHQENLHADALGIAPRFQYVTDEVVAAVSLQWARYGFHPAYHGWVVYKDVIENGNTLFPSGLQAPVHPRVAGFGKSLGRLPVGMPENEFSPLRNVMAEALSELSCPEMAPMQIGKTGTVVTQMDIADTYEISPEGLAMFIDFELDRHIDMYHGTSASPTAELKTAFQYGYLTASAPGVLATDRIVATTDHFHRHGLLTQDLDHLLSISNSVEKGYQQTQDEFAF